MTTVSVLVPLDAGLPLSWMRIWGCGSPRRRTAAVTDHYRDVVLLALFTVERLETGDDSRPVTVVTAAYNEL